MNEERQAFLNAIIANPADDATRLIYADWLDENNQEQLASFIRLQIAVANYERTYPTEMEQCFSDDYAGWVVRKKRSRNLGYEHVRWLTDNDPLFSRWNRRDYGGLEVKRGFACKFWCTNKDFRSFAYRISAQHPIESIRLRGLCPGYDRETKAFCWYKTRSLIGSLSYLVYKKSHERDEEGGRLAAQLFSPHQTEDDAQKSLSEWLLYRCSCMRG